MKKKIARSELDTGHIDFSDLQIGSQLPVVTLGEILQEEFLKPLNLSARALARDLDVPANRITEIIKGERGITADTVIRLAKRFGGSAEFWMSLQVARDLEVARKEFGSVAA